jgi:hypothetical protein
VIFGLVHRLGSHLPEFAFGADQTYSSPSLPLDLRDYATRIGRRSMTECSYRIRATLMNVGDAIEAQ